MESVNNTNFGLKLQVVHILRLAIAAVARFFLSLYYGSKGEKLPPITDDVLKLPAVDVARKIRRNEITSTEVVEACIRRIKDVNPIVNCFVEDRYSDALKEAKEADELIRGEKMTEAQLEEEKPFLGVPFTTKDSVGVKGLHMTSGVLSRKDNIAIEDAVVIKLLRDKGAIVLGLTNVPELCMSMETYNHIYGTTKNPYNTTRIVGGSSGGEGCIQAVAGSFFGVGTDIAGSIRMPAYFNGIFGHKPSRNIVSNRGQFPSSEESELHKPLVGTGPMTRYAVDLRPLLNVMAGENGKKLKLNCKVEIEKLKVYYQFCSGAPLTDPVDSDIIEAIKKVIKYLRAKHKIETKEVKIDYLKMSMDIWAANMKSEIKFSSILLKSGNIFNFCKEVFKCFLSCSQNTLSVISFLRWLDYTGPKFGSEKHKSYLKKKDELEKALKDLLDDDGVLLYPTHPTKAIYHNEPLFRVLNISYTSIINSLGFPSTAVPLGLSEDGLPLGIQVIANHNNDRLCLALAEELEKGFGGWREP